MGICFCFLAFINAFFLICRNVPLFLKNGVGKFLSNPPLYTIQRKNFAFSLLFRKKSYLCTRLSACGEIGRRARLRIWCRETCRFESYQAHVHRREMFERMFLFFLFWYGINAGRVGVDLYQKIIEAFSLPLAKKSVVQ